MKRQRHDSDDDSDASPIENEVKQEPSNPHTTFALSKRRVKPKVIPVAAATMARANSRNISSFEGTNKEEYNNNNEYSHTSAGAVDNPLLQRVTSKPMKPLRTNWDNCISDDLLVSLPNQSYNSNEDRTLSNAKESNQSHYSGDIIITSSSKCDYTDGVEYGEGTTDSSVPKIAENNMTVDFSTRSCRLFLSKYRLPYGTKVAEDRDTPSSSSNTNTTNTNTNQYYGHNGSVCTTVPPHSQQHHDMHGTPYASLSSSFTNTSIEIPNQITTGRNSCSILPHMSSTRHPSRLLKSEEKSTNATTTNATAGGVTTKVKSANLSIDIGRQGLTHYYFTPYRDTIIKHYNSSFSEVMHADELIYEEHDEGPKPPIILHLYHRSCCSLNEIRKAYMGEIIEHDSNKGKHISDVSSSGIQEVSHNLISDHGTVGVGCTPAGFRWDGIIRGNPTVLRQYAKSKETVLRKSLL